jgi:hypothetical protein
MPHVAVLVLGDLGRSPRMQYHCRSLASRQDTTVCACVRVRVRVSVCVCSTWAVCETAGGGCCCVGVRLLVWCVDGVWCVDLVCVSMSASLSVCVCLSACMLCCLSLSLSLSPSLSRGDRCRWQYLSGSVLRNSARFYSVTRATWWRCRIGLVCRPSMQYDGGVG